MDPGQDGVVDGATAKPPWKNQKMAFASFESI